MNRLVGGEVMGEDNRVPQQRVLIQAEHETWPPELLESLRRRGYDMRPRRQKARSGTLALDLEGTLVSPVGQTPDDPGLHPRPGLRRFLSTVEQIFRRVVVYTAVSRSVVPDILADLVAGGHAPEWFAMVEVFNPRYGVERVGKKNLRVVGPRGQVLLVDDDPYYVRKDQAREWIWVAPFRLEPGWEQDRELDRVCREIIKLRGGLYE